MGEYEGDSRNHGPAIALVNTSRLVVTDPILIGFHLCATHRAIGRYFWPKA